MARRVMGLWDKLPKQDQNTAKVIVDHAFLDTSPAANEIAQNKAPGLRGIMYAKLTTAIGQWALSPVDDYIDDLIETVFSIIGGSTKEMTISEVTSMLWALDDKNFSAAMHGLTLAARAVMNQERTAQIEADTQGLKQAYADAEKTKGAQQMTEVKQEHWAADSKTRGALARLAETLGFRAEEVPGVLGVERLSDYTSTQAEAELALRNMHDYYIARMKELIKSEPVAGQSAEATVIAWTHVFTPTGVDISVTARSGATVDEIVGTTLKLDTALRMLEHAGFRTTISIPVETVRKAQAPQPNAAPKPEGKMMPEQHVGEGEDEEPEQTPASKAPPKVASTAPAAAKVPPAAATGTDKEQKPKRFQVGKIEIGKTQAGAPRIDFYAKGHQYADVSWAASVESFLERFEQVVGAGWEVDHFSNIGASYGPEYVGNWWVTTEISDRPKIKGKGFYENIAEIEVAAS